MLSSLVATILSAQRALQQDLAVSIREMGLDPWATAAALGFAFALGVVHALTPGHGKLVVFSYFLGRRARVREGIAMAGKIAFTHSAVAAALAILFGAAATSFGRPVGPAGTIETVSYGVITAIGAYYLWRALRGSGGGARGVPDSGAGHAVRKAVLPFAVGLLPCPLTMLIVAFAISHGSVLRGLVLAGVVGAGAALTIAGVGLLAIVLRAGLFGRVDPEARGYALVLRGLEIGSSAVILAVGLLFLAGSLAPR